VQGKNLLTMFEALDYLSLMAVSAASFTKGHPVIASSANLAFNRQKVKVDESTLRTDLASGDDMFLLQHARSARDVRMGFWASPGVSVFTRFDGGVKGFLQRRIRWASKAPAYSQPDLIFLSLLVFALNLCIALLLILSILGSYSFTIPIIALAAKSLADFPFLAFYLFKTGQQKLLVVFLPLQAVYPFYITFTAISGFFKSARWKDRKIAQHD